MARKRKEKYAPAKRTIEEVVLKPIQKWPADWHHGIYFKIKKKFKKKALRGKWCQPVRRAKDGKRMVMRLVKPMTGWRGPTVVIDPKFVKEVYR